VGECGEHSHGVAANPRRLSENRRISPSRSTAGERAAAALAGRTLTTGASVWPAASPSSSHLGHWKLGIRPPPWSRGRSTRQRLVGGPTMSVPHVTGSPSPVPATSLQVGQNLASFVAGSRQTTGPQARALAPRRGLEATAVQRPVDGLTEPNRPVVARVRQPDGSPGCWAQLLLRHAGHLHDEVAIATMIARPVAQPAPSATNRHHAPRILRLIGRSVAPGG
jgi:hypothetical protein